MKIAIASGKGGTGKTTLATNLFSLLAEEKKVVLVDLDVEEPNSGLFLKLKQVKVENKYKKTPKWDKEKCNLCGICQDVCNFNAIIQLKNEIMIFPELCHSCYACSELCPTSALPMIDEKMGILSYYKNNNFSFVESRLDIGQEQATPLIAQTIEYVDEKFPEKTIKIYDAPPGTSCPVIEAVKDVDFVILVTEPTPFGLHDLKLAVEVILKLKKKFGVVINRYGIGNNDVINYCNNENIPILAKIQNDRRVAEIYSKGRLIYKEIGEFKRELEKIKAYILKKNEGSDS